MYTGIFKNGLPDDCVCLNLRKENSIKNARHPMYKVLKIGQIQVDDKKNFKFAEVKFKNGDSYIGHIKNEKFNGQGTYTISNGGSHVTKVIGTFSDGIPVGNCKYITFEKEAGKVRKKIKNVKFEGTYNQNMNTSTDNIHEVPVLQEFTTKSEIVFKNRNSDLEDLKSLVSIESAKEHGYVSSIEDYDQFKEFCDALEVENILKADLDQIIEVTSYFSLEDLLRDPFLTGSKI